MYISQSFIKSKLRSLALKVFKIIENNGEARFDSNGERKFIHNMFKQSFKAVNEKLILFDVGANIGNYTKMLLDQFDYNKLNDFIIYCFEPAQATFKELHSKFNNSPNIVLTRKGVSDESGKHTIYYDTEKSGLASLYKRNLKAHSIEFNKSEQIETIRLDDFIQSNVIHHIHFMKIDIEGHELKAFQGMGQYLNSQFIDFIQFEYGGANLDSKTSLMDLYELFESRGFKIAKIMPKGLQIRDYKPFMENFDYANYVAISENKMRT